MRSDTFGVPVAHFTMGQSTFENYVPNCAEKCSQPEYKGWGIGRIFMLKTRKFANFNKFTKMSHCKFVNVSKRQ